MFNASQRTKQLRCKDYPGTNTSQETVTISPQWCCGINFWCLNSSENHPFPALILCQNGLMHCQWVPAALLPAQCQQYLGASCPKCSWVPAQPGMHSSACEWMRHGLSWGNRKGSVTHSGHSRPMPTSSLDPLMGTDFPLPQGNSMTRSLFSCLILQG